MKSYACFVHLPERETPHLRFVNVYDETELVRAVGDLAHEWPHFRKINVRDDSSRILATYTQADSPRLLSRHC